MCRFDNFGRGPQTTEITIPNRDNYKFHDYIVRAKSNQLSLLDYSIHVNRISGTCYAIGIMRHSDLLPNVRDRKSGAMLYTIAVVLILLWLLGMVSSFTINGFIHILLVIAVVVVLLRIINGRKPI